jgi:hypothetical protein
MQSRSLMLPPRYLGWLKAFGAVSVYVILAVAIYWDIWSTNPPSVTQLGGDQFGTIWFLRWIPFAMVHGQNPLFTTYVNYPHGVNLLNNTSVPLLGVVGAPLTWVWGAIATYNFWCTAALAGSAWAAYLLVRRMVSWRPAAFVAGLLYGFSPYELAQGGHLNLSFVVLPPLILLCVYELVVKQEGSPRRWGVLLGLLVTAQFFVSTEVLASTAVVVGVCLMAVVVIGHHSIGSHRRFAGMGALWATVVATTLLAYPIWFALRGPGYISGPIQLVPQAYRADLLGPVVPGVHQWISAPALNKRSQLFAGSISENGSYLGLTLVVTLLIGTVRLWRRSAVVRVAAIAGASAFVISLGARLVVGNAPTVPATGVPLPESLFTHLPLLANTIPVRYSVYVVLFAAVLLAVILDHLHGGLRSRCHRIPRWLTTTGGWTVPGLLAIVCLLPLLPVVPTGPIGPVGIPTYFTSSSAWRIPNGSVALLYPYPTAILPSAVLWQSATDMRFKMPGGYFLVPSGPHHAIAYTPGLLYGADTLTARTLSRAFTNGPPPETAGLRRALREQLKSWQVQTIVANLTGVPDPGASLRFLIWLTGRLPTKEPEVDVWYSLNRSNHRSKVHPGPRVRASRRPALLKFTSEQFG